jgi:hypothetical protein
MNIRIENPSKEKIQHLSNLIQSTVNNVDHDDMTRLLEKVKSNPKIVKKALKFI